MTATTDNSYEHSRTVAEAELLMAIATAAAEEEDLSYVLSVALDHLGSVVQFTGGSIALLEDDYLVIRAARGPFADAALGRRLAHNSGPTWRVVETGTPFLSHDLLATPWKPTSNFRSFLAVPLRWRDHILGLLEVDSTEPNAFDTADQALLQQIALVLSGPIELARRLSSLQQEIAERQRAEKYQTVQYTVTRILADSPNFDAAAPRILQTIGELLGWEVGTTWCVDHLTHELVCTKTWHAATPRASEFAAATYQLRLRRGVGLPGRVWEHGEPAWVADVLQDDNFSRRAIADKAGIHGAFAFPISGQNDLFGVVEFFSRTIQPPDDELLRTTTALGVQIGQFIERRRAHTAIQFQAQLLDVVEQAVIATDIDGIITYWNRFAEQLYGWSAAEVIGRNITDTVPAQQMCEQAAEIMARLRRGESWAGEFLVRHRDGTAFPAMVITSPIKDEAGKLVGIVGISQDITARKRAEGALRESEARYRAVVEQVSDSIFLADATTKRILEANAAYQGLIGYSAAELQQLTLYDVIADERASIDRYAEHVLTTKHAFIGERNHRRKDGTLVAVEVSVNLITYEGRDVLCVVIRDLTERKHAEKAQRFLAEASRLLAASLDYQTTLQRVAQLVVPYLADWCTVDIVEEDGHVERLAMAHVDPAKVEWARELQQRYPYDPSTPYGVPQVLRTGQPELYHEISDSLLQTIARDTEHLNILRAVGLTSAMVVPLVARGRTFGALSFAVAESGRRYGLTDLAVAEALAYHAAFAIDNARLYHEAQTAIQARDEFLSIASHELKTPLTTLLGHTQALQRRATREAAMSERDQRALTIITRQALRLNKQIATLLDLSRIQLGHFRFEQRPVDLCSLGRRVVADLEPTLERHAVQFSCAPESVVVHGDEVSLEQVIQNLLQNAIKYSPQGGNIAVHIEERGTEARLAVSDEGIGIPATAQPYLFQRFYRASNVEPNAIKGMGIGLYLVSEIVTRHGGWVDVRSEVGQGSTFTVYLPLLADTYRRTTPSGEVVPS